MTWYVLVGNPVMSAAEAVEPVAVFDDKEKMDKYVSDSILEPSENIGGCVFTHKEGSLLRAFNRMFEYGEQCEQKWPNGYYEVHGASGCNGDEDGKTCFGSPAYHVIEGELNERGKSLPLNPELPKEDTKEKSGE